MEITKRCYYEYRGPDRTKGVIVHFVLFVNKSEVITWSMPSVMPDLGGDSWIGTPEEFRKFFTPLGAKS